MLVEFRSEPQKLKVLELERYLCNVDFQVKPVVLRVREEILNGDIFGGEEV